MRGAYNKVPVSSGQCQVFSNEFIPLNQVTFECYLLDRLSSITWYLSKNQFFSFLELAGVKRNGTENVVSFRANFVVFQTFDRRSHRLVTSVRPSGIEAQARPALPHIPFCTSPMPPGQKPRDEKVVQTIQAIKDCGWRSTNQFFDGEVCWMGWEVVGFWLN